MRMLLAVIHIEWNVKRFAMCVMWAGKRKAAKMNACNVLHSFRFLFVVWWKAKGVDDGGKIKISN